MPALRGLHLIRGGAMTPALTPRPKARAEDDDTAAAADEMPVMTVEFSRFDTWYEIDSWWEGRFLERTKKGAFKRTIKSLGPAGVKVLFNHGRDMQIHQKVLGVASLLEERDTSPYMEVPLLDTSYNRDLVPGLEAGAYGSSFMFEVIGESWNREPGQADHNPEGLPERTITEIKLFEAGPVTWPANPDATAGLRSGVDWLMEELAERDSDQYQELVRSFAAFRAIHGLGTPSREDGPAAPGSPHPQAPAPGIEPARHARGLTAAQRKRRLSLLGVKR
ncbi:HK97 family phage prohead protease [Streptomyces antibioticus]|uniref:HK97 family phage prohead protease n=1 Tax=Streptomyces antibioticus TaxID=1890 RepID=UPI0036B0062E